MSRICCSPFRRNRTRNDGPPAEHVSDHPIGLVLCHKVCGARLDLSRELLPRPQPATTVSHKGPIALPSWPHRLMPTVVRLRIATIQLAYVQRQIGLRRFAEEMRMIVHQAVGTAKPPKQSTTWASKKRNRDRSRSSTTMSCRALPRLVPWERSFAGHMSDVKTCPRFFFPARPGPRRWALCASAKSCGPATTTNGRGSPSHLTYLDRILSGPLCAAVVPHLHEVLAGN